jgi:hypothetical protein
MATSRRSIAPAPSGRDWRFETIRVFEEIVQGNLGALHWLNPMVEAMSIAVHHGIVKVKFTNEWPGAESDRRMTMIVERQCQVGGQGIVRMGVRVVQGNTTIGQFQGGQWVLNQKVPIRVHKAVLHINEELQQIFPAIYQG